MNGSRDIVFKRCGCTSEETGRQLTSECPRLFEPGHGSWYYAVQVTTVGGRKARYRRGGFPTKEKAVAARQILLDGPSGEAAAGAWTLARWLRYWPSRACARRPCTATATISSGTSSRPWAGSPWPTSPPRRLQAAFDLLARQRTRQGTRVAASTVDRVRIRSSGPTSGSPRGGATGSARRSRCGRCASSPRQKPYSSKAIRPGQNGCAARDLNPNPRIKKRRLRGRFSTWPAGDGCLRDDFSRRVPVRRRILESCAD
jgi:hypothetical protein